MKTSDRLQKLGTDRQVKSEATRQETIKKTTDLKEKQVQKQRAILKAGRQSLDITRQQITAATKSAAIRETAAEKNFRANRRARKEQGLLVAGKKREENPWKKDGYRLAQKNCF